MTTGQNWIDATRRQVLGTYVEKRNKVASTYNPGDGVLNLSQDMSAITPGTILSAGLNVFYVWSVNGSAATVDGGQNGSTDVAVSAGTLVRVNPILTDAEIWQELANDVASLSGEGIYGINSSDLSYSPIYTGYDLGATAATNLIDIIEVKYLTPGPQKDMPRLPKTGWRLTRNAVVADIPSGISLQILAPSPQNVSGYLVRVVWKSLLVAPATPATDVSASGLQPSAYDLPPIGAAIRIMAGREIPRNFTQNQGDVRRGAEVQAGAILQSSNGLKMERQQRIAVEKARLASMYAITRD